MYQKIKVSLVDISEGRLREVDQDWADCLSGMFLETGQKTPIDVIKSGRRFTLVAGAHRLTAAKIAKWKEIDARIIETDGSLLEANDLRLHEILENLGRKDFNPLERCEALAEMKRIYEETHPETKRGGDRKSQAVQNKDKNQVAIFAFCSSAKESTGLSRRSVELAVQIFNALSPATRERLKGTPYTQKQSDLKTLAALDHEKQSSVLDLILGDDPKAASIADALTLLSGKQPEPESTRMLRTVTDNVKKLPAVARNSLFRVYQKEIMALAQKEGWFDE